MLLQNLLLSDLTEEQISYIRSIVPESIPTENISALTGWFYACLDKGLKTGDAASLEKIMKVAGLSAEAIKVDVKQNIDVSLLDFSTMSDDELLAILGEQEIIDADYEEVTADVEE